MSKQSNRCFACNEVYFNADIEGHYRVCKAVNRTPDQPQADEDSARSLLNGLYDDFKKLEPAHTPEYWYTRLDALITREREQAKREVLEPIVANIKASKGTHKDFKADTVQYLENCLALVTPNEPKEAE